MSSPDHKSPTLQIATRPDGALIVSGELDMATAPQLRAAVDRLIAEGAAQVVLDLGNLQFCDSSGLSVFVQSHQALHEAGGSLVLDHPSTRLRTLLSTTQLDHELNIR